MAGPFLPIQAVNRSQAVRIGKGASSTVLKPNVTSYVDTSDGNVRRDLQRHSALGSYIIVGPLTYRAGASQIISNALLATPATIATTETLVLSLAIPAGFLAIGSVLDIEAMGTVSAASATTMTANVRLGTVGSVAGDTTVAAAASVASITTSVGWRLDVEGEVRAIGSGTSAILAANARLTSGTTGIVHGTFASSTFNSTTAQFIDLSFVATGGTTQVITVQNANIKFFQ